MSKFVYSPTGKSDQRDFFHGTWVEDPYQWLEDVDSPETVEWIDFERGGDRHLGFPGSGAEYRKLKRHRCEKLI